MLMIWLVEVAGMELWTTWFNAVAGLRPACARWRTFAWMVVVLLGLSLRPELAGVTSIVRVLALVSRSGRVEPLTFLMVSHRFGLDTASGVW